MERRHLFDRLTPAEVAYIREDALSLYVKALPVLIDQTHDKRRVVPSEYRDRAHWTAALEEEFGAYESLDDRLADDLQEELTRSELVYLYNSIVDEPPQIRGKLKKMIDEFPESNPPTLKESLMPPS